MLSAFWRGLAPLEKRALCTVIALHVFAITLPYFWAWAVTPPGFEYSGLLFSPDDQNVHLAWAREAANGHIFARDLFTAESLDTHERPLFFNALTFLIGTLARTGLPAIWIYHALRVAFAIIALLIFYALSTHVTQDQRTRIVALILAAFSGGAGFLAPLFPGLIWIDKPNGHFPMMPEAFTFASHFIYALNAASFALLLGVYLCALESHQNENAAARKRAAWCGFGCALLLSNLHTYDAIPLVITLAAWTALGRASTLAATFNARLKATAIIICGTLLPVFYQVVVFAGSSEFRFKALTQTPAPPLWDVLASYGFLIPLAIAGGVLTLRAPIKNENSAAPRLLVIWVVVTFACLYAPVSFARKMIEGVHLPLCLLAALGLMALLSRLELRGIRRVAAPAVLALCCVSSLQFILWCAVENPRDAGNYNDSRGPIMPPLYLSLGDAAALRFLNAALSPQDKSARAVLCWPKLGNYVPRETGAFVYAGHWAETLNLTSNYEPPNKLTQVLIIYAGTMSEPQARAWLRQNHIGWIILGYYEKHSGFHLPLNLPKIFDQNGTAIYEVK